MTQEYVMLLTTVASEEQASKLAHEIVKARLAACVQIEAIRSVYRWKDEVHDEPEWRLAIKTRAEKYAELERFIRERHAYQTPEIVRLEIAGGAAEYLRWIDACVGEE